MKYFLDTEFIEGTQKKFFGVTKPTIDLISIGIVDENGKEYYTLCNEFNLKEAWSRCDVKMNMDYKPNQSDGDYNPRVIKDYWIRDHVLLPIYREFISGDMRNHFDFSYPTMKYILKMYGKSRKTISEEIQIFTGRKMVEMVEDKFGHGHWLLDEKPKFYGYYSSYDWVVFCWIFGKMKDLPEAFPMFCMDLKQMMEEKQLPKEWKRTHCPDPIGEHNALIDAHWNRKLYNLLKNIE